MESISGNGLHEAKPLPDQLWRDTRLEQVGGKRIAQRLRTGS